MKKHLYHEFFSFDEKWDHVEKVHEKQVSRRSQYFSRKQENIATGIADFPVYENQKCVKSFLERIYIDENFTPENEIVVHIPVPYDISNNHWIVDLWSYLDQSLEQSFFNHVQLRDDELVVVPQKTVNVEAHGTQSCTASVSYTVVQYPEYEKYIPLRNYLYDNKIEHMDYLLYLELYNQYARIEDYENIPFELYISLVEDSFVPSDLVIKNLKQLYD